MALSGSADKNPYRHVRLKLFAINIGALLSIWALLLAIVYSLMAHELYQVLDDQLRLAAIRLIHNYDSGNITNSDPYSLGAQDTNYSLWRITPQGTGWMAAFVDGNPFVNIRSLYGRATAASQEGGGYYTIRTEGIQYRAFYAIVHTEKGEYLIRITQPTGPTDTTLGSLLWTLGIAGLAALALTIAIGLWLANRSIDPMILSWQRQQQFVADASHELRTPLSIIRTNLEILLRSPSHTIESEMKYLGNAYGEVLRTSSLIEDLLTLARADSKEQLIEKQPVELVRVVEEVVDTVQPLAEQQNKELIAVIPQNPCSTLGDVARLRQLVLILIDNALRYSNAGDQISVTVECDTQHTTLRVVDTGIGIEPTMLPKIFDRFVRGDQVRSRRQQGSGLGLSIAKWIVDAHGGTISVSSSLGVGTTVTIVLPP